jgi:hypothetical protein
LQQRLGLVAFGALKLCDLRSDELVGHVAPGLGGVVVCGHDVQCVLLGPLSARVESHVLGLFVGAGRLGAVKRGPHLHA